MEQRNPSTTANRAPLRGAPREAHQRAGDEQNREAMEFLRMLVKRSRGEQQFRENFLNKCELYRAHGLITEEQQQELEKLWMEMWPSEAQQKARVMGFLRRQAESDNSSTFQAGRFFGACEALCMAGVITAEQWQEFDDVREASREKNASENGANA